MVECGRFVWPLPGMRNRNRGTAMGAMRSPAQPLCSGAHVDCEHCAARGFAVCASLTPAELRKLGTLASTSRLQPGQTLFEEGDPADWVFSVTEGMLKLYKLLHDGRRQITGFAIVGDFLGLALADSYVYSAEAVTAVRLCRFRRSVFLELVRSTPRLEHALLTRASCELAAAQDQMLLLGRKTAKERLASFLLHLAERQRVFGERAIQLWMSRTDIADFLGLTIETVSRTLTAMRKAGIIELQGKSVLHVRDAQALRQMAGS